jgi:hypothetical protein
MLADSAMRLKLKLWFGIYSFMVWYISSAAFTKIQDCDMEEERV